MGLMTVKIDGIEFYVHEKYERYGANHQGDIIQIFTHKVPKQSIDCNGSIMVNIGWIYSKRSKILKSKFVYECFNGLINADDVIWHINGNNFDTRVSNLICLS